MTVEEIYRTTDKDMMERQTAEIRAACDFLQQNRETLRQVGFDDIVKLLNPIRSCITVMKKHYPKAPEIWNEMQKLDPYHIVSVLQAAQNEGKPEPTEDIRRLRDWLEFPERYKESYSDMFEEQPLPWEKWMDGQRREEMDLHMEDPLYVFEWDPRIEKKWKKRYEKYVEEFKHGE